jgi:carbon monoxide dehydrogenase subunit G
MFRIRAEYNDELEVNASLERAREFFADPLNFVGLMPGVEKITSETGGIRRWLIRAEVPVVGAISQLFAVRQTDDQEHRIEWSPVSDEKKNLLRYAAAFEEAGTRTLIRIAQRVELRRQQAKELHLLAGLIGEHRLSQEMQKRVSEMMSAFLQHARTKLEQQGATS